MLLRGVRMIGSVCALVVHCSELKPACPEDHAFGCPPGGAGILACRARPGSTGSTTGGWVSHTLDSMRLFDASQHWGAGVPDTGARPCSKHVPGAANQNAICMLNPVCSPDTHAPHLHPCPHSLAQLFVTFLHPLLVKAIDDRDGVPVTADKQGGCECMS
jgi:hypothetical protein